MTYDTDTNKFKPVHPTSLNVPTPTKCVISLVKNNFCK